MIKFFGIALVLMISFSTKAQTAQEVDTTIYLEGQVEKTATFPGGIEGWRRYIERNLNANLANKIKFKENENSSEQTVKVFFIVGKEGNVYNVKAANYTDVHPRLAKEAVRVIKEGPNWTPAVLNGKQVNYQALQYITWRRDKY